MGSYSSLATTENPRSKVLLIGVGGWGSCGIIPNPLDQRIHHSFSMLVQDVARFATVDFLISCLNIVPPSRYISYIWYAGAKVSVQSTRAGEFPDLLKEYINETEPNQVYLIGHSYGGWVVFNAASEGVKSQAIFAFDPIDAQHCLPVDDFFMGIGINVEGCKKAPQVDYVTISRSTQKIFQLWQPHGPIRSAPIDKPFVVNQMFDVNHASFNGRQKNKTTYAHRMLGSEPTAWRAVCQSIFRINGWEPSMCRAIETDGDGKYLNYARPEAPTLDVSGITFEPAKVIQTPNKILCKKDEPGTSGTIRWHIGAEKVEGGWTLAPYRNGKHLFDPGDHDRLLSETNTIGGLKNIAHPENTIWLSLDPQWDGTFHGRFYSSKFGFDVSMLECSYQE